MALCIAILTPRWTVHVSDAPGGTPRTAVWRRGRWRGLVTAVRVGDAAPILTFSAELAAARPNADARSLAAALADRGPLGIPEGDTTLMLTGFGLDAEGRDVDFQWSVTDFEDPDHEGMTRFSVVGQDLVPSPGRPGYRGSAAAETSFSVAVSSTAEPSTALNRHLEGLPKRIRKGGAGEAALAAATMIQAVIPGPVALVMLDHGGSVEGGVLEAGKLRPLTAASGDGLHPL
jgi:hypothetical protein